MPRGRKKLGTIDEQIEVLRNEIEALAVRVYPDLNLVSRFLDKLI